ncbi:MAG: hypothetical protein AB8B52_06085 [Winogradskyella sp.]|uniref:hypothetical protein n=1 Tax=Winogradskyella sp. TaxID=1883156 RepID=UPI0038581D2B
MRLLCILMLSLVFTQGYSQNSTLIKNINARANELQHSLNKAGDSLVFKCERTIFEVVIFNSDFQRVVKLRDTKGSISIADIPVGKYVVEALLADKLIVMTLIRDKPLTLPEPNLMITENTIPAPVVDVKLPLPKAKSSESIVKKTDLAVAGKKRPRELLTRRLNPEKKYKAVATYWIVYKVNSGTGSEKIQKIADQNDVNRMISKIEIDMKTKTGRFNELIVWKVYDSSKFLEHKRKHKDDYIEITSESFQLEPYFQNVNSPESL